jgi:type II secretory pathway predicted ATPase ExeA
MLSDVLDYYGLAKEFRHAGFYETAHHRQLLKDLRAAVRSGGLIALCGIVGSGKTVMLRRLQEVLEKEGKILVSKSLSVDKERVTLGTLITALFYDLAPKKEVRIPSQGEKRERGLQELFRQGKKPVALCVDEAHDLNGHTLRGLKRLIEVVQDGGGRLAVVLVGHPKLKNDLRRPTMEEVGYRATVFALDGVAEAKREFIEWLLGECAQESVPPHAIIDRDAIELLAERLATPLQIEQYLTLALEAGFAVGAKPVTAAVVETVLAAHASDWEAALTRNGYDIRTLAGLLSTNPKEIRALLRGHLEAARAQELHDQMLAAGLPVA